MQNPPQGPIYQPPQPPHPTPYPNYPNTPYPVYPGQPQQMPYQPYQAYPAPQQPYPPRTSNNPLRAEFWRNMSTLKIAVVTVVSCLLVITVCVVLVLLPPHVSKGSVYSGVPLQPTATTMPTNTPKPTGSQPLSGATLGGTQDGFTHVLGTPTDRSGVPWYAVKLARGTTAPLCYCTEHTGSDGNPHLAWFHIDAPGGTTWSDQQGVTIARPFLPPDAKHVRDFTDPQVGLIHVYVSAALAATFPASEFTDSGNGQQLPPGTFGVACGQPGPSQCSITTGN